VYGERGRLWELELRPSVAKMRQLIKKVACEANSKDEIADCVAVALTRDRLVPLLKAYVDTARRLKVGEFIETCEEWERSQPRGAPCFRKNRSGVAVQGRAPGNSQSYPVKKPLTCFTCGKVGHMSRECRSRPPGEAAMAPVTVEAPAASGSSRGKEIRSYMF